MRPATQVIRAGLQPKAQGKPFSPGVTFAGTYHASGDIAEIPYTYRRYHNPTWTQFESALAELEGGTAVSFASGMAAVAAVFGSTLKRGDILVMPSDSYYTTRLLADGFFSNIGVQVRRAPTAGDGLRKLLEGARLLWLETPANPGLDVCDIAALSEAAHRQNLLVAVDNTTATVLSQRPLELGADFSVASDTKGLTGHSDLILGHVAVADSAHADKLLSWRTQVGAVPGPMEVWLADRSLGNSGNALSQAIQQRLDCCRIPSDACGNPQLAVARSFKRSVSRHRLATDALLRPSHQFRLSDGAHAERFLASCMLLFEATSFGGIHTTAERRARWGGDDIPPGFIRLSVGCEDAQDLIEDIEQALDSL